MVKKLMVLLLLLLMAAAPAMASSVSLQWDPNPEPYPDGYRIFIHEAGADYDYTKPAWQGTETTCTIDGLKPGVVYYAVARAYWGDDESGNSNEVDWRSTMAPMNLKVVITVPIN